MAKRKNPAAVALGRRGGKPADGAGGRARWADVPPEERARMMSELVTQRHCKEAKRKKRKKKS
jgi:hypothetical protein